MITTHIAHLIHNSLRPAPPTVRLRCTLSLWSAVKAMVHSVYDQPDAVSVPALTYVAEKLPAAADHLDAARADLLAFTAFPKDVWVQRSGPTTPTSVSTRKSADAPTL